VVRTLGLSENYPDGSTGNLPFIHFTRKNIAFAARTGLFYTVGKGIARRIFRIPQQILTIVALHDLPAIGRFSLGWVSLAFCAILRPIFRRIQRFLRFFTPEEYITLLSDAQHRRLAPDERKMILLSVFPAQKFAHAVSLPYI